MKTSELSGAALDWAVAKAEGEKAERHHGEVVTWKTIAYREYRLVWRPSTDWAQGGPIIEREGIELNRYAGEWMATLVTGGVSISEEQGSTQLIAAMRSYVASQLGDEIDIPEELL